jgi:hypothetical protein
MKKRILGDIAYARSGDKGPNVNVGVIFKNESDYNNALDNLTEKVVKSYFSDMVKGDVIRYELPNLNALNFILNDSLEGGGSETLINDAQGKTFGQAILMMEIDF